MGDYPVGQALLKPARAGKTVLVFAPKGGVGKTTVASHLLVAAAKAGLQVLGVDFDPQRGLDLWVDSREKHALAEHLIHFGHARARLTEWSSVFQHAPDYDLMVMDTPPGVDGRETEIYEIASRVDLILMPTGQGPQDIKHVRPWMEQFKARGFKAQFVLNKISQRNWTSYRDAKQALVDLADVVCEIPTYEDMYQTGNGITALDSSKLKGNLDFESLYKTVTRGVGI